MIGCSVLLVENHVEMRDRIQSLIAEEYEIVSVIERGDEALQVARRLTPDIVLLDISLPGKSGLRVLPAMRAALPAAAIIVLTSHDSDIYREEAFKRGADAYVLKSMAATDLNESIARSLELRRIPSFVRDCC